MSKSTNTELQMRVLSLKGYVEVCAQLGVDGFDLLKSIGIRPGDLENPERRLAAQLVIDALELAAAKTDNDSFAILMARRRTFSDLGSLALLMQHLETPRQVIEAAIQNRRHFNDLLQVKIDIMDAEAQISWDLYPAHDARQAVNLGISLAFLLLTGSSGGKWHPRAVHVTHSRPERIELWREFFTCPLEFDSHFNGFTCNLAALDSRNPRADALMANHVLELLKFSPISGHDEPWLDQMRRFIERQLPEGRISLSEVAHSAGHSPRHLQRLLQENGTTFARLRDEVRLSVAKRHLQTSGRAIADVADMVGYASTAAFSRWFYQCTGMQPSRWRSMYKG
jgi:AraC-like DNA-binding protein